MLMLCVAVRVTVYAVATEVWMVLAADSLHGWPGARTSSRAIQRPMR